MLNPPFRNLRVKLKQYDRANSSHLVVANCDQKKSTMHHIIAFSIGFLSALFSSFSCEFLKYFVFYEISSINHYLITFFSW